MKPRKLSEYELATAKWHKLIKGSKRKDKAEIYFASKRKPKLQAPSMQSVASCVAKYYDTSYDRLLNYRNHKVIARYRWVLFYICKKIFGYSFRKIGSKFGMSHKMVYRGLEKLKELMLVNPNVETDIRSIRIQLNRRFAQ